MYETYKAHGREWTKCVLTQESLTELINSIVRVNEAVVRVNEALLASLQQPKSKD